MVKTKSFPFLLLNLLLIPSAQAFSDITPTDPLYSATTYLGKIRTIDFKANQPFEREQTLSRAAALKMILSVSHHKIDQTFPSVFNDTEPNAWYTNLANYAAAANLIQVNGQNPQFRPNETINQATFLTLLYRTFDYPFDKDQELNLPAGLSYSDWFALPINEALKQGLIVREEDNTVNIGQELNRGEGAEMLFKFLQKNGHLQPQALLNLTEEHLLQTINFLQIKDINQAKQSMENAQDFIRLAQTQNGRNKVIRSAGAITDSMQSLVQAYRHGQDGTLENVIREAKTAWQNAENSRNLNQQNAKLAQEIQKLAHDLAEQARAAQKIKL